MYISFPSFMDIIFEYSYMCFIWNIPRGQEVSKGPCSDLNGGEIELNGIRA